MAMDLYFYNECGFSQSVLNCMTNLHCEDKIIKKNIRENPDHETELITLDRRQDRAGPGDRRQADQRLGRNQSIPSREIHVAVGGTRWSTKRGRNHFRPFFCPFVFRIPGV